LLVSDLALVQTSLINMPSFGLPSCV